MTTASRTHPTPRVIVVTSADAGYFELMKEMVLSLYDRTDTRSVALAAYDLGLTEPQKNWLRTYTDHIVAPHWHFDAPETEKTTRNLSYVARPFLRDYFPGFDVYMWVDADVWLQDRTVIDRFVSGALEKGAAVARENEPAYRLQPWLLMWTAKHFLRGYGPLKGLWLLSRPHINTGVFAMRADAPHWALWIACYQKAITRSGDVMPHDQFALNQAIYEFDLATEFLPASHNWICDRGIPIWDEETERFCEPYAPHRPISALHLAGPAKRKSYTIRTLGGDRIRTNFRYQGAKARTRQAIPKALIPRWLSR